MDSVVDCIVVGSGCTGAMAAQTLVEGGCQVMMLDVGIDDAVYKSTIPDKDFLSIRKNDPGQYRYFIGEQFESLAWGKLGKGEQITPPRKHIFKKVDEYIPVQSKTFSPAESLGYGGLGIGWGIGCWEFSKEELEAARLPYAPMIDAYEKVCARIGISATKDDAVGYSIGKLKGYQKSPQMDTNCRLIYKKYQAHRDAIQRKGFTMGRLPLALLTEDLGPRKKYAYRDLDFYSDMDQSAYRPWITIDMLRKRRKFTYQGDILVTHFTERKDRVTVHGINVKTQSKVSFACKRLILGTGVLGSARIAMRSSGKEKIRTSLLCNPYSYIPCIQPRRVGKVAEPKKLGFAQLALFLDETHTGRDIASASLYSYQSLMLFRMIRQVPLNFSDARTIMRYLISGIVIMGVHQPDERADSKYLELVGDKKSLTGYALKATYAPTESEIADRLRREKKYMAVVRKLGLYPIKSFDPGFGSSIHYAGTLPFGDNEDDACTLSAEGRLHGTRNVYVADGSGFNYLPAKGITFSLMANAHVTAENVLRHV
jgi:hypothetical protein